MFGSGGEPDLCRAVCSENFPGLFPPPDALAGRDGLALHPHLRPPVRASDSVPRVTRASNEPSRSLKLYNHGEGPLLGPLAPTTAFTFKNLF